MKPCYFLCEMPSSELHQRKEIAVRTTIDLDFFIISKTGANRQMYNSNMATTIEEAQQYRQQAEDNARNGQFLLASLFVSRAIKAYTKLNDSKALQELKHLSIEYRKKADKEYKHVSFSEQVPREEVERIIQVFSRYKYVGRNLMNIGSARMFLQDFKKIEQFANDNQPLSMVLGNHSVTDQNGHLISDEDFGNYWIASQYGIWQDYSTQMLYVILNKMKTEGKLSSGALLNYFKKGRHYTPDECRKLTVVFEALERNDFVSALYVLVPTFEAVFMRMSGELGIDTVALGRGKPTTSQRTLSTELLLSDGFIKVWGIDLCRQIDFVLFSPYGFRLRHEIAHGSIRAERCNLYTFAAVFYFYLRLMATVKVTPNKIT